MWLDDAGGATLEIQNGNVLVNKRSGRKHVLNDTGLAFAEIIDRHGTSDDAISEVGKQFALSPAQAEQELQQFLALVDQGQQCSGSILPGAQHAVLEPTAGCNGGCPHCYHGSHSDGWDADQLSAALDGLDRAGIKSVSLTGGEVFSPHYVDQFFLLLPELQRRGVTVSSISTNATFVTEQVVERICNSVERTSVFRISLDALRGDLLDRVRPGYRRLDDPYFPVGRLDQAGFGLVFTTNISTQTPEDVVGIGDHLRRYGAVQAWNVRMAVPVHYGNGLRVRAKGRLRHLLSGRPEPGLGIPVYEALLRRHAAEPFPFELRMGNYVMTSLLRHPHALARLDDPHPCREDKDLVTIKATGNVTQCPILNELDPDLTVQRPPGLAGPALDEDYTATLPLADLRVGDMACETCRFRPVCGGGCRLYALAYDQGLTGCDLPAFALLTWVVEDPSGIFRENWPRYHQRILELVGPTTSGDFMQTAPQASSEMQARYWDRGWVAVPDVFGAAEVEAVAKTAMAVSSGEITRSSAPSYTVDQSDDGRVAPRKVDWPFLKHATFRTFVLDDRLVELVEMILGPEPCLLRDQLFMKPPGFGSAKPYHQENAPLGIEPADEFLVAWIALDDATVDNGCLRYIDGSHRSAVAHRPVAGREFDVAATTDATYHCRESTVEVSRGAVLLHHSLMLHASMGNRSGSWRRAYSSHWVTDRVTSSTGALDHAYSRRLATRPAAIQAP